MNEVFTLSLLVLSLYPTKGNEELMKTKTNEKWEMNKENSNAQNE